MKVQESSWTTPDGVELYVREWQPDGKCKAVVVLVHGLGEHCGRYEHVAKAFAAAGIDMLGFDLRGHGKSKGARGHASFENILNDIQHFLDEVKGNHPDLPSFIYGHSLGGCLVLDYCIKRKPSLAGAIVTSPGLGVATSVPPAKMMLARVMARLLPTFALDNGLDTSGLARDPEIEKAYVNDPLVHPKISARLGLDLLTTGPWVIEHAAEFSLPLLLLQGSKDRLVSPAATQEFASRVSGDITFKLFEGSFHELHNEPEKFETIGLMIDWINKHLK